MGSKLFWSTLFGIVAIVLLAATLYVRSIAPNTVTKANPTATVIPSPTSIPTPQLLLTLPTDDTYVESAATRVVGKAAPGSTVSIVGPADTIIVDVDQNGNFSSEIKLATGVNELAITQVTGGGIESSLTRTIVYEPEETQ